MARQVRLVRKAWHVPAMIAAFAATTMTTQTAWAAMNFCAAPAMQNSERTNADPGVKALVQMVQSHLNDAPKARAKLHTEGTLPGQGIHDESVDAEKDLALMRDAALAWRATGDERYLRLVDRFLYAWVASAFIAKMTSGYIADIDKQKRPLTGTYRNNWQSHRIKLVAMGAFTIDDRRLVNAAQRLYVEHIGDNIAPDGSTVDFAERDALHYVTYDLQPLVTAALAARRHNRNWLTERAQSGATLAAALDWLTPYALGTRTHEEFVGSKVPFDATRREAGLPGFTGAWDPKNAAELFHLAARLDGRYAPIALRLAPSPPAWLAVCLPLAAR
jgi:hypothetical protein